jgi:hypothetical protein
MYRASSAAMFGPLRAASFHGQVTPGESTSAMICVGRSSVSISMPLATETSGTSLGTNGLSLVQTLRMYCVGMALTTSEQLPKASESLAVSRTAWGIFAPRSRRVFSRVWISRSIDSSNAPQMVTSLPPLVSMIEQTVAMAPSPRIVTFSGIERQLYRLGRGKSSLGLSQLFRGEILEELDHRGLLGIARHTDGGQSHRVGGTRIRPGAEEHDGGVAIIETGGDEQRRRSRGVGAIHISAVLDQQIDNAAGAGAGNLCRVHQRRLAKPIELVHIHAPGEHDLDLGDVALDDPVKQRVKTTVVRQPGALPVREHVACKRPDHRGGDEQHQGNQAPVVQGWDETH